MWLLDYNLSIAVAVGFIALAGVAAMVGGMVTSTVLTLVVIPVLYHLWRRRGLNGS
jgi:Cu/Ag efflux pump CusA